MNVVLLLLATAASTGSHPAPASSCSTCNSGATEVISAPATSECCDKPSWKDRLKGMFSKKGSCCQEAAPCCESAPAAAPCCTSAPGAAPCCTSAPAATSCCEADTSSKPCLFTRLKGLFSKKGGGDCCATTSDCSTGGCATGGCATGGCDSGHAAPAAVHGHAGSHQPIAPPHYPQSEAAHTAPAYPAPAYPAPAYPAPAYQAPVNGGHHNSGAPITVPQPINGGNAGQVTNPVPTNTGNITNPRPLPAGNKNAEPIQRAPLKDNNNSNKEDARLMPTPVVQPAAAKVETEVKNPFDLDRRYEKRVSHTTDYSKLTGQLFYVHTDGGLWILRFASLAAENANGGSVILARDRQMDNYREGDLVAVDGQVISDRGSSKLGGPLYRVQNIVLVDRPQ